MSVPNSIGPNSKPDPFENYDGSLSCLMCTRWDGTECSKRGWTNSDPKRPCQMVYRHLKRDQAEPPRMFDDSTSCKVVKQQRAHYVSAFHIKAEAKALREMGLSVSEMSRISGMDRNSINRILFGKREHVLDTTLKRWRDAEPIMERRASEICRRRSLRG